MSNNKKYIFEGIPHELYEGEMSDLGYKSEAEAIEYAMKIFKMIIRNIPQLK